LNRNSSKKENERRKRCNDGEYEDEKQRAKLVNEEKKNNESCKM
jgi:hypothetical protein